MQIHVILRKLQEAYEQIKQKLRVKRDKSTC